MHNRSPPLCEFTVHDVPRKCEKMHIEAVYVLDYKQVMFEHYKRGFKPALLFPAELRVILPSSGEKKWLLSASEAEKLIEDLNTTHSPGWLLFKNVLLCCSNLLSADSG